MTVAYNRYAVKEIIPGTDFMTGEPTTITLYDYSKPVEPEAKYVGTTLCDREENYYDDSDGYAHVWSPEQGLHRVGTWTTRAQSSHLYTKVDADNPEGEHYAAMVEAHVVALAGLMVLMVQKKNRDTLIEAFTPAKGDYVRVARGRKVPVGTEGTVIWTGERSYSHWQAKYGTPDLRVGIKDAAGNVHWTDAKNVDMVDEPVYTLESESQAYYEARIRESFAISKSLTALHREWCRASSGLRYYL